MNVHAIQTGWVRIKTAQVERGRFGLLSVFADRRWTDWLPTYAWLIDHKDGPIVVDTGQGTHLLETGRSWQPYVRWEVAFRIAPEEEIGPHLKALGLPPRDVKTVVLTHLHMDHDGGLRHFPGSSILVPRGELELAKGRMGLVRGYLPNRWPSWFDPEPLDLQSAVAGPFAASRPVTEAGDVVVVATPGHTAHHVSVLVHDGGATLMLAGDASYNQALMLAGKADGVSSNVAASRATLSAIGDLAGKQPLIYLPTHDPDAARRLSAREAAPRPGG